MNGIGEEAAKVLKSAAVSAHYPSFESMKQCADAWKGVVDALDVLVPDWCDQEGRGADLAIKAIRSLAAAKANCNVRSAAEAIIDSLMQNWQGEQGTRLAIKQGSGSGELDLGGWCRDAAVNATVEALEPYMQAPPRTEQAEGWDARSAGSLPEKIILQGQGTQPNWFFVAELQQQKWHNNLPVYATLDPINPAPKPDRDG